MMLALMTERARTMLRRDLLREPTAAEVNMLATWLETSGALAPDSEDLGNTCVGPAMPRRCPTEGASATTFRAPT
jgi:hypothetical protein